MPRRHLPLGLGRDLHRALALAGDMAALFRKELSAAATQLGKALEDLNDGLTALRRVGISLSDRRSTSWRASH
jgi:hypothetical protein